MSIFNYGIDSFNNLFTSICKIINDYINLLSKNHPISVLNLNSQVILFHPITPISAFSFNPLFSIHPLLPLNYPLLLIPFNLGVLERNSWNFQRTNSRISIVDLDSTTFVLFVKLISQWLVGSVISFSWFF